jgi:hypothetical protein
MKKLFLRHYDAVAMFAAIVPATPAAAAVISAEPTFGNFDTTFSLFASGFQSNEIVDTWVSLPNRNTVSTGALRANENGTVKWAFTPNTSYGGGEYIAVAHGRVSGEVFVKFNVVAPPKEKPSDNNNNNDSTNNPVPIPTLSERTAQFSAQGYAPGENVGVWYNLPNGSVVAYKTLTADAWGNLQFPFVVSQGWMFGGYQVVGRGWQSKHTEYITFSWFGKVTDVRASNPITRPAPYYDFWETGFTPNGRVSIWVGLPNGTSQAMTMTTANAKGNVYYRVNISPDWLYGGYIVAAYDWQTRVTKWQRFSYFGQVNRMYP